MQPVDPPRPEFSLCKIGKWALYRLHDGRFVAHRQKYETVRKGTIFTHEPMYIEWPSSTQDVPEVTGQEFTKAMNEWKAGVM